VSSEGWAFTLEFEDEEATVVSCKVKSVKYREVLRSRRDLPAAKRLRFVWDSKVQNLACSLLNVCISVLFAKS